MSLSRAADRENLCYAASQIGVTLLLLIIIIPMIYKQTISYGTYNEELIQKSNATYHTQKNDADLLFQTLRELMKTNPGRVYAGRGGAWGKTFEIADTPYFMHLSTYGIPTVLWLPQTWSNNSDTEQYFSEDNESHYELYNIKYVVSPIEQKPQPFWTLIKETEHWKLYGVGDSQKSTIVQSNNLPISQSPNLPISPSSPGYITSGVSPSVVFSDKLSLGNVVRLWIQSPYPGKSIFPELNLTYSKSLASKGEALRSKNLLPHFTMLDEATYLTPDGTSHSLFAEPPQYMTPWEWPEAFLQYYKSDKSTNPTNQFNNVTMNQLNNIIQITSQSNDTDMIFKATVEVKEKCPTCSVILKQTYHPNWKATVRKLSSPNLPISPSSSVPTIDVFPSYVAVRLEEPGDYEVVFTYTPSKLKMFLLVTAVACSLSFCFILYRNKEKRK